MKSGDTKIKLVKPSVIVSTGLKHCPKCNIIKKLDDFYKTKTRPDGYQYDCKKCNLNTRQLNKIKAKVRGNAPYDPLLNY